MLSLVYEDFSKEKRKRKTTVENGVDRMAVKVGGSVDMLEAPHEHAWNTTQFYTP